MPLLTLLPDQEQSLLWGTGPLHLPHCPEILSGDSSCAALTHSALMLWWMAWGALIMFRPSSQLLILQGSLDFAPQVQLLMHLLLPSINLSGVNLTGATGAAPSKGDLIRLQVAALQALREFIVYRFASAMPDCVSGCSHYLTE